MPVYNAAPYLGEAIRSILAQTLSDFEFIIADDGSTDRSPEILRALAAQDTRLRPVFLEHGHQPRATCIELAGGGFIAYMDADDLALPQRLARQAAWLHDSGIDVGGTCAQSFGEASSLFWFPESHAAICRELLFRPALLLGTVMLRAEIAKHYPFDERALFKDYDLWTRLAPHYRLGNLPQILLRYRQHPAQSTRRHRAQIGAEAIAISARFFETQYPTATPAERERFRRIATRAPFPELDELEQAGLWLIELAQLPDLFLKQRMALRWLELCFASASLGLDVYQLYVRLLPEFGENAGTDSDALRLACAQ
jgi:glycosyltransferase involved in cell wall biosynthesis